jgi:hypothetical protein
MAATLKYVGTPAQWDVSANPNDLVTQSYIGFLLAQNLTQTQVNTQIASLLTPYATQAGVTTQLTGLATPAYINTQIANYVFANTVEHANGPVAIDATSDLIAPGLINAASDQTWPKPFWSPTAYNTATVTATTTPGQLYTQAIPDPGYPYVLACYGQVDCSVAADDGTIPQVVVRNGSITGQAVALGYGCGESYLGPSPGQIASQAFVNQSFPLTGTATTVTGMLANNTGGFQSTMVGNFLQVPVTESATITASFTFSGSAPSTAKGAAAVTTQCQIITSSGTILVTGATVTGDGTCTASFTGTLNAGTLYGVQIGEAAAATFANVTAGTLTISPSTVQNMAPANIIPVPYDQQTSTVGATTLYTMLQSSNSSTAVTAATDFPGLWVMPIPWTPPPPAVPPTSVTYDSSSNGTYANTNNIQWQQILGVNANLLLVGVGTFFATGGFAGWTRTVTAGGLPMISLGAQLNGNANTHGWSELFYLASPPTGNVTISVTETDVGGDTPWISGVSSAYQAVRTLGTPVFSSGGSLVTDVATAPIGSLANGMVVGLLCSGPNHSITPVNGIQRGVEPSGATANVCQVELLDATGTGSSITLNGTQNAGATCSTIGIALNF